MTVPRESLDPAPAGANASLTIQVDFRQRVIHPIGELDLTTTDQVTAALTQLQDDGPTVIHLDLSGVTFFGADAVNAIVRARNTQRERSSELVLDLVPPPVQRILDLCRIETAA
ncbi:MAG TPA: STAS domain-containing protein [Mycobacteriales bacterium]|nr:STAS domain-containing protein [Mycobacteriales bacterium]